MIVKSQRESDCIYIVVSGLVAFQAADTRREIERQHKEALESLRRKQDEVEFTATKKQEDFINALKERIEGLEDEKRAQNEKHQELVLELAELKKYGGKMSDSGANGPESIASDIDLLQV